MLIHVQHGSEINVSEIFDPVAAIVVYDDVGDAIAMANDSEFGLAAYVFGLEGEVLRVAERREAGMVAINSGVLSDPAAPFGGVKQSGLGREGREEGIREFLEESTSRYLGDRSENTGGNNRAELSVTWCSV